MWATAESAPTIRRSLGERHATILTDAVATDQTDGQQGSANPPGWGPEARAYAHGDLQEGNNGDRQSPRAGAAMKHDPERGNLFPPGSSEALLSYGMKVRKSVELADRIAALDDTLPLPETPVPVFRQVLNCRHIPLRHFAPDSEYPLSGEILSPWDCIS